MKTNLDKKDLTSTKNSNNVVKTSEKVQERRERVPMHEQQRMLTVEKDQDYIYRKFNDEGDRLQRCLLAGWEFVDKEFGQSLKGTVRLQDPTFRHSALSEDVGHGVIAYCMRIPKEWYHADQAAKQRKITEKEKGLLTKQKLSDEKNNTIDEKRIIGEISIDHKK